MQQIQLKQCVFFFQTCHNYIQGIKQTNKQKTQTFIFLQFWKLRTQIKESVGLISLIAVCQKCMRHYTIHNVLPFLCVSLYSITFIDTNHIEVSPSMSFYFISFTILKLQSEVLYVRFQHRNLTGIEVTQFIS